MIAEEMVERMRMFLWGLTMLTAIWMGVGRVLGATLHWRKCLSFLIFTSIIHLRQEYSDSE